MGIFSFLKKAPKAQEPEQAPVPAPESANTASAPGWGDRPEGLDKFGEALWTAVDKALKGEVNELHIMDNQKKWSNYRFNDVTNQWESDYTPEQWDKYLNVHGGEKEPGSPEKFREDIGELRKALETGIAHYQYAAVSAHDSGTSSDKDNVGMIYRNPELLQSGLSMIERRIAISEGAFDRNLLNRASLKSLAIAVSKAAEKMDVLPLLTSVVIYSGKNDEKMPDIPFNEYGYYGSNGDKNGVVAINIDNVINRSADVYISHDIDCQDATGYALMENICREMLPIHNKDIYSGNGQLTREDSDRIAKEISEMQEFRNMPLFIKNAPRNKIKEIVGDDVMDEIGTRDERQYTQEKDEHNEHEHEDDDLTH